MAALSSLPMLCSVLISKSWPTSHRPLLVTRCLAPVEKRFRLQVERNASCSRLKELRTHRWSRWETNECSYAWDWQVDEQVYLVKGSMQVTPKDCQDSASFCAGDVVRFPKWFCAELSFGNNTELRYRFRAHGDD
eukprot:c18224_g1_i1 orf=175-579(+)